MNIKKTLTSAAIVAAITFSACLPVCASYIIPDGSVSTPKLADGSVTQAKLAARAIGSTVAAGGFATSSSSGSFSTTSISYVIVTNLSVTITTAGRPVRLSLQPDGTTNTCAFEAVVSGGGNGFLTGSFFNGSTPLNSDVVQVFSGTPGVLIPCGAINFIDTPVAGTYTYTYQVKSNNAGTTTGLVGHAILSAYEL